MSLNHYLKYFNGLAYADGEASVNMCQSEQCDPEPVCDDSTGLGHFTMFKQPHTSSSDCKEYQLVMDGGAQHCAYNSSNFTFSGPYGVYNDTTFDGKDCFRAPEFGKDCTKCFRYFATAFKDEYTSADECVEAQCHYPVWCGAYGDSAQFYFDFETGPR